MLAIEVDGDSYDLKYEEDIARQKILEKLGLRFLRFDNLEVKMDIHKVLRVMEAWIIENQ